MKYAEIKEVYDAAVEDWPMASEEVRSGYNNLHRSIEEYIEAVQEQAFIYGYQRAWERFGGMRHEDL